VADIVESEADNPSLRQITMQNEDPDLPPEPPEIVVVPDPYGGEELEGEQLSN